MGLTLRINGEDRAIASDPETPLLYVLRDELKLKGAKLACGLEQCGACAVIADGEAVMSCVTPAAAFEGSIITTVEALGETEIGARVQAAFIETSAAQCGYCTAGLVVAAAALLERHEVPDRQTILDALSRHLCRCGAHSRVLRAIELAAGTDA